MQQDFCEEHGFDRALSAPYEFETLHVQTVQHVLHAVWDSDSALSGETQRRSVEQLLSYHSVKEWSANLRCQRSRRGTLDRDER